jgi:hypothetical protein
MKTESAISLVAVFLLACNVTFAAPFNAGSTGADGPLIVTSNRTLNLPPDGIFNFTSITVAPNATLTFTRNPLNTPVYLLATTDVVINGVIDVSGKEHQGVVAGVGGPGGFDGGFGGFGLNNTAGDGLGPGAGRGSAGNGTFGTNYANALLVPLIGGSGSAGVNGNPGLGGQGGGGAILIASSAKLTVNGAIRAIGGEVASDCYDATYYGAGSGGAIRLVAAIVDGNGFLDTRGGIARYTDHPSWYCRATVYAGAGRIRIDCQDRNAFRLITYAGTSSRGSQMFVFPPVVPRLDITAAAGTTIAEGTGQSVSIELPVGSPTNQVVRVQARNFANDVPIQVIVTPENGPSRTFSTNISLLSGNPPNVAVNVTIPLGTVNRINAWTR